MIQITQIWLSTTAMDMRSGSNKLIAHIIKHHQGIKPHCAYLFYNKTGTRLKVLIHDGLGVWLYTRQLDDSKFHGLGNQLAKRPLTDTHGLTLTQSQFNALISGLPWHNLGKDLLTPLI
nr:IS66 family insertion sequence element accessory protein TnpB [Moraxella sp.]